MCCAVQGVRLSSTDGLVFLLAGTDGSLTLFNTANYATYGATPAAEIWTSVSAGAYSGTSYLSMQSVSGSPYLPCPLLCLPQRRRGLLHRSWL